MTVFTISRMNIITRCFRACSWGTKSLAHCGLLLLIRVRSCSRARCLFHHNVEQIRRVRRVSTCVIPGRFFKRLSHSHCRLPYSVGQRAPQKDVCFPKRNDFSFNIGAFQLGGWYQIAPGAATLRSSAIHSCNQKNIP